MDGQDDHATAAETGAEAQTEAHAETKRDKVRRCLFAPLDFRHRREMAGEAGRKWLDALADELGYMSEPRLAALAELLRGHGEGAARNFWPDRATFIAFAERIEPRPLDQLPAVCSWFGSVEGPRAIEDGTLVETWEYIQRTKRPPYSDQARRLVAENAARSRRQLEVNADRRRAGLGVDPDLAAWERWYRDLEARCRAIVERERAARGHGDGNGDGNGVAA